MTLTQTPKTLNITHSTIIPPPGGWLPSRYYVVEVAYGMNNPIHKVIFYTGFLNDETGDPAGYNCILSACTNDEVLTIEDAWYLNAVKHIPELDNTF